MKPPILDNKQFMQIILLLLTATIFSKLFLKFNYSLGGSFVLCTLIYCFMPIVLLFKELGSFLCMFSMALCGILVLNFMAYWEAVNGINVIFIVLLQICIFWIFLWYSFAVDWLFKPPSQLDEPELQKFLAVKRPLDQAFFFMGLLFSVFGSLLIMGIYRDASDLYMGIPILRAHLVSATSLLLAFLISLVYLYKIDDLVIKGVLSGRMLDFKKYELLTGKRVDSKAPDKKTIIKWYKIIIAVIVIMGTVVEPLRGMWLMWIETVLLLVLMSLIFWRIYKLHD